MVGEWKSNEVSISSRFVGKNPINNPESKTEKSIIFSLESNSPRCSHMDILFSEISFSLLNFYPYLILLNKKN
ncbi:MAG: hypothetical protein ACFFFT_18925 [Candidatus Thorarchaeota archaeon]